MNLNGSTNFSFGWIFHNLFKHSIIFGHSGCSLFVANISNTALKLLTRVILYIFSCFLRSRRGIPIYFPTSSVWDFLFLSFLTAIRDYYFLKTQTLLSDDGLNVLEENQLGGIMKVMVDVSRNGEREPIIL